MFRGFFAQKRFLKLMRKSYLRDVSAGNHIEKGLSSTDSPL
jgi:hypothetical protein